MTRREKADGYESVVHIAAMWAPCSEELTILLSGSRKLI
jgi:hypothetical protein